MADMGELTVKRLHELTVTQLGEPVVAKGAWIMMPSDRRYQVVLVGWTLMRGGHARHRILLPLRRQATAVRRWSGSGGLDRIDRKILLDL
jgi:hypothetical protein